MNELYAGVDIHREKYVGCIVDERGNTIFEKSFPPTKEGAQSFLCGMPVRSIAIEACGMWRHAMRIFRDIGCEVKLSNPKKTKDIAGKKKTDKIDAKTLANLLRTGFLPEVYIPTDEMLRYRDIARSKEELTHMRVEIQVKIKSCLLREGIPYQDKLWSKEGLKWLSMLKNQNIEMLLRIYNQLCLEEKAAMTGIRKISSSMRLTNLLMTMDGIAEFSSLMVLTEIADINRFSTPKHLVMYAGLCPGIYQTGNTERDVINQAVNKHLKWIITECSGRASQIKGSRFQGYYAKICKRKGPKVARRATARKMLTIVWHMLKNKEPFHAS